MKNRPLSLAAVILLVFSLTAAAAEDTDDSNPEEESKVSPVQAVTGPLFQPGVLLQSIANFESDAPDGRNGFSLAKARVNVTGQVDGGWDYLVQTDFASSLTLLDARVRFRSDAPVGITTGMYKVPFSREWLTSAAKIDFVKRSQVVSALSPKRDIGVTLGANIGGAVNLRAGMFNGNGRSLSGNNNNRFLYVGRVELTPPNLSEMLTAGVNIAYNHIGDRAEDLKEVLAGADLRISRQSILLSAEAIYGERAQTDAGNLRSFGYHVTAGYALPTQRPQQVLLRLDQYARDLDAAGSMLLVGGYNVNPSEVVGVQLNYVVPVDDRSFDHHQVLLDLQFTW